MGLLGVKCTADKLSKLKIRVLKQMIATSECVPRDPFSGSLAVLRTDLHVLRDPFSGSLAVLRTDLHVLRDPFSGSLAVLRTDLYADTKAAWCDSATVPGQVIVSKA